MSCPPALGNLLNRWTPSCPRVLPKGNEGGARATLCRCCWSSGCRLVSRPCLVVINLGHGLAEAQPGQLWSLTVKTFGSETELISVACFGFGFDLSRLKRSLMVGRKFLALWLVALIHSSGLVMIILIHIKISLPIICNTQITHKRGLHEGLCLWSFEPMELTLSGEGTIEVWLIRSRM